MSEENIIGRNAVAEALKSEMNISKIYVLYSAHGGSLNEIYALAKRQSIPIARVDSKQFAELTSNLSRDQSAQGIVATVSKIKYETLQSLIDAASDKEYPFLLVLDRVQDPQNFGAILRSAAFFNVDGVIISKDQQAPLNETAIKASAGSAFHLKIARETNLHQTIMELKKSGYWIATSAVKAPLSIIEMDARVPLSVIIGNEGSGVRRILRDKSDITFSIPQLGKIDSLNVSAAAGIICYEISRQKGTLSRKDMIGT
ncbi:MAG TPA: 23S rRNA (guanosine(2251)-2'-O)-methyltransferase RlmB [Candidatus Acidoferrales bacterium]|nr:23S rRNA (guanosine(2251)-2'-O)-methyltransferase RlmB [Candidatus Acidoferrales bacterium]